MSGASRSITSGALGSRIGIVTSPIASAVTVLSPLSTGSSPSQLPVASARRTVAWMTIAPTVIVTSAVPPAADAV